MYWQDLAKKYRNSGILVDTNLLLLLMLGSVDESCIGKKRTERYSVEQFHFLSDYLKDFKHLITTPHILTEVSNLGGSALTGKWREAFFILLGMPGLFYLEATEDFVVEQNLARLNVEPFNLVRLGLTDAVIAKLCEKEILLISDDYDLVGLVTGLGGEAINFTHLWESKLKL